MRLMRRQPTHSEVWQHYGEATGRDVGDVVFCEVYGIFRLAVILQQTWYRFHHGQATNPAFASFGDLARYLEGRCLQVIEPG